MYTESTEAVRDYEIQITGVSNYGQSFDIPVTLKVRQACIDIAPVLGLYEN